MKDKTKTLLGKSYAPAVQTRLSRFPSKEQLPIASWLIQTPIGTNFALQILENLEDLSRREESRPSTILTQILSQLERDQLQPKDLGRRVRDSLHLNLHPLSSGQEKKFLEFEQALGLPQGVRLFPSQNFEGNSFSMEIRFEQANELREKLKELLRSVQNGVWENLKEF